MTHYANDTICALATPVGGAIAVVRVSGSQSYPVLGRLLRQDLSACAPATLRHASLYSPEGEEIDDVVVAFYRAPHSYTGEDAIEISCHGSAYIVHQILDALTKAGCRQAEPGEYTRRAYLNGKMDLSQAEAVADLISSSNQASHRLALSQLKGHVRTALETLRERLLRLTSLLELELDFSDHDDLVFADRSELLSLARSIEDHVAALARTYHIGKAVKEGIPVAIVGKTNVGKSTLLNHLVGEDRALVSDVHGTTRDSIEETTLIGGLTFRFVDTAGLRHTDDVVEQMGIERTWQKLDEALLKQDSAAYMQSANRDTVLLCQIESQLGVSNIDAIMAVDGIDGAMIGPNDMSQDFGILGQYAHPAMQAAFRQVIDAAARHGKVSGAHFGATAPLQPWLSQGMTLNMCSSDLGLLMSGAKELSCLR